MNIHIIPRLCPTALGMSMAQHIKEAGHRLSDVELASFVIGVVDSEWPNVPGKQKIIVVDPGKVETVPEGAILFSAFTLTMIDNPTVDLADFLKNPLVPFSKVSYNYRFENWRFDVNRVTLKTTSFEGKTVQECDRKAIAHMEELSTQEAYSWDGIRVLRIDTPAVAEKTTFLKDNGRQKNDD